MRTAHFGYTYQHWVAELFLAMMDAEREIDSLDIEVNEKHSFDDVTITLGTSKYCCQIKDFSERSIRDNIKPILKNALTGKHTRIDFFNSPYYFPGNILKLLDQYQIPIDLNLFHSHFQDYLKLSLVEMTTKD